MKKVKRTVAMIILLSLALDQLTKQMVLDAAIGAEPQMITRILPFFNLVLVWNPGVSFGMFSNVQPSWAPLALMVVTGGMTFALAVWLWNTTRPLTALALGLVISGALGNIIDRVLYGAVVDFLDFHLAGHHWPAFNVADSVIFIGVVLLVWESIVEARETKREKTNDA